MSEENPSTDDPMQFLHDLAAGSPYPVEAYAFVARAMPTRTPGDAAQHISAAQLCWRIRALAYEAFGPDARRRLEDWSIRSCDDFGEIVYRMIDAGLMAKADQDLREDFHDVFSFDDAFEGPATPIDTGGPLQVRLSTLFVVTTIAAIAFAGASRSGLYGAMGTVFASWMGLIGLYCLVPAVRHRDRGWVLGVCIGLGFTAAAVVLFVSIIMH